MLITNIYGHKRIIKITKAPKGRLNPITKYSLIFNNHFPFPYIPHCGKHFSLPSFLTFTLAGQRIPSHLPKTVTSDLLYLYNISLPRVKSNKDTCKISGDWLGRIYPWNDCLGSCVTQKHIYSFLQHYKALHKYLEPKK